MNELDIFYGEDWVELCDMYEISTTYSQDGTNEVCRIFIYKLDDSIPICIYSVPYKTHIQCDKCDFIDYMLICANVARILGKSADDVRKDCIGYLIPFE